MGPSLPSLLLRVTVYIGGVLAADSGYAQGLLQGLREDVRAPDGSPPSQDSAHDRPAEDDDDGRQQGRSCWSDDDEEGTSFMLGIGKLAFWTVTSPVWLPKSLINDPTFGPGDFARYPYDGDLDGYMLPAAASESPELASDRHAWLVRLRGEYGGAFDDLSRAGGQVLVDSASRWGIDTEATYLHEQATGGRSDQLWLGDANVVYRFAQSPRIQMRTGVGLNWLADEYGSDVGFNFTYGGDFFPVAPWILSAEIDWGRLGDAGLFQGRATVGVHFHRLEIYTGYDYLDIGDTPINSAISGVRVWF